MIRNTLTRILAGVAALSLATGLAFGVQPEEKKEAPKKAPAKSAPAAKRYFERIAYPKAKPLATPKVVRDTLPNGMKVIFMENREFPVVNMMLTLRGGALVEPKKCLTQLFGEALRSGGTQSMTGDKVDEFLERLGANIESQADEDSIGISASSLTENLDKVLPLFADFVQKPGFEQAKVDLVKKQARSAISRRNDEVNGIARREFSKLIYGADSPYTKQLEYADVDAITRDDMVNYHAKTFRPDQAILVAWGDFSASDLKQKLVQTLGSWTASGGYKAPALPAIPDAASSVNYVEKKDIEQTFILIGHKGMRLDDPDYPAMYLLSDILGGGFSSRIFCKVRTEKGLAYGAGGGMSPSMSHPGTLGFYTSTKPGSTADAIQTILDEIRKVRETPVTDAELKRAKDSYMNSLAFENDSEAKVLRRLSQFEFYGYPANFNDTFRAAIEKVTKEDILRVAQKHIHPDSFTIVAVGNAEKFDKPLSTFGQVRTLDISIPEPKIVEEIPAATPESLAKGSELMMAAVKAKGSALTSVKEIVTEGAITAQTPMGEMELKGTTTFIFPNRLRADITTPMGPMVQVIDGDKGWMKFGPQVQDLPGSAVAEQAAGFATEYGCILLLQKAAARQLEAQALGTEKFADQEAQAVLVKVGDKSVRILLSSDGKVLGTRKTANTPEGPKEVVETFSAYSDFNGIQIPMQSVQTVDGKPQASTKLSSVKVNPGVDPALFQKPAK